MSASAELNTLDLPGFVAGYLAMIRTYDAELNSLMLVVLEVLIVGKRSWFLFLFFSQAFRLTRDIHQA